MAVRVRKDGTILCAAKYPPLPSDIYIDDALHYRLSVELGLLVTEPMECLFGLGGHAQHGEWWWRGHVPDGAQVVTVAPDEETE